MNKRTIEINSLERNLYHVRFCCDGKVNHEKYIPVASNFELEATRWIEGGEEGALTEIIQKTRAFVIAFRDMPDDFGETSETFTVLMNWVSTMQSSNPEILEAIEAVQMTEEFRDNDEALAGSPEFWQRVIEHLRIQFIQF